jgi:hypothetical protein
MLKRRSGNKTSEYINEEVFIDVGKGEVIGRFKYSRKAPEKAAYKLFLRKLMKEIDKDLVVLNRIHYTGCEEGTRYKDRQFVETYHEMILG